MENEVKLPIFQLYEYIKDEKHVIIHMMSGEHYFKAKIVGFDEFMNLSLQETVKFSKKNSEEKV